MATQVTITDIISQFGKYYIDSGQNKTRLLTLMKQKTVTTNYATTKIVNDTLYRFANTYFGELIQQFQSQFTAKGTAAFKPNEIQLRNIKVDVFLTPDEIVESWLGFLSDKDEQDRTKWPLVKYLMEEWITPQTHHDLETIAYGKGVHADPIVGTAGAAMNVMDGIIKMVTDGIADVNKPMNSVALSAFTPTNTFDNIEEFVDEIDAPFNTMPFYVFVDPKIEKDYWRDKRNTHGADTNYSDGKAKTIDFMPNMEIVGLPSLAGTGAVIATPKGNFLHIRRTSGIPTPLVGAKDLRQVQIGFDWWEALGFGYNELVWAYLPPAEPESIAVTPETASIAQGASQQFSATVLPAGAVQDVTWSIETATGLTITADGLAATTASTPAGTYTVTATSDEDGSITGTAELTVTV